MIMGYIDPGSGSIMLQLLAGSIISLLFIVKTYWLKLKMMLQKLSHLFSPQSRK